LVDLVLRILAIDPGSTMGWATDVAGVLRWGVEDISLRRTSTEGLRWLKLTRWLEAWTEGIPWNNVLMVYEEQNNFDRHMSSGVDVGKTTAAFLLEFCERRGIACEAVGLSKLKAFAIPALPRPRKGEPKRAPLDRGKAAIIAAARTRLQAPGVDDLSEHEADALWLYWWAKERYA